MQTNRKGVIMARRAQQLKGNVMPQYTEEPDTGVVFVYHLNDLVEAKQKQQMLDSGELKPDDSGFKLNKKRLTEDMIATFGEGVLGKQESAYQSVSHWLKMMPTNFNYKWLAIWCEYLSVGIDQIVEVKPNLRSDK